MKMRLTMVLAVVVMAMAAGQGLAQTKVVTADELRTATEGEPIALGQVDSVDAVGAITGASVTADSYSLGGGTITGAPSRVWGTTDAGAAIEYSEGDNVSFADGQISAAGWESPSRTPEAITIAPTTTVTRTTAYRKLDVTEEITLLTWHADYSTNHTHLVEMSWRTGGYSITPDYDTISSNSWAAATNVLTAASNAYLTVYWSKDLEGTLWYVQPASR